MKTVKIGGLIVGLAVAAIVGYQFLVFSKRAGDAVLATLQSGERTALHNEEIAANLASAKFGDRLVSIDASLKSLLSETTQTVQAVRPAIAETTATARAARLAIVEAAGTAKAARVAIEGVKVPDVEPLLRRTDALLEQTTRLVRDTDASAPPLLAASQRIVDRLDTLVTESELTATLRTTGRIAANIERDQGNVSAIIANAVPVSEAVKNETKVIEQKVGHVRRFFKAIAGWF
jgi:hypothetical protein